MICVVVRYKVQRRKSIATSSAQLQRNSLPQSNMPPPVCIKEIHHHHIFRVKKSSPWPTTQSSPAKKAKSKSLTNQTNIPTPSKMSYPQQEPSASRMAGRSRMRGWKQPIFNSNTCSIQIMQQRTGRPPSLQTGPQRAQKRLRREKSPTSCSIILRTNLMSVRFILKAPRRKTTQNLTLSNVPLTALMRQHQSFAMSKLLPSRTRIICTATKSGGY